MSYSMVPMSDTTANAAAQTTQAEVVASEPRRMRPSEVRQRAMANRLKEEMDGMGQAREDLGGYHDAGVFYGAAAPVPNSFGAEVGIVTKDEKSGTVQRTGIGFYLRSDHICNTRFDQMPAVQVP